MGAIYLGSSHHLRSWDRLLKANGASHWVQTNKITFGRKQNIVVEGKVAGILPTWKYNKAEKDDSMTRCWEMGGSSCTKYRGSLVPCGRHLEEEREDAR